ncbi:11-beta-hydroxysteroid dehydrogenase 1B-like [Iris pallida]|uniref:11-beta-hydroxysteroid dehydrogenase 1B-like n=1 Tax=Iris pallida TaxID=29817 RepID=A0AAX6G4B0_IRIPA|nr:11-beta-hydroxysteroid dehydrogenase 1B-like [Iris pallida]KAJ6823195.1 11-beta-hydroxysteroid dehydrogenase 1B-like [Iris pallida]
MQRSTPDLLFSITARSSSPSDNNFFLHHKFFTAGLLFHLSRSTDQEFSSSLRLELRNSENQDSNS